MRKGPRGVAALGGAVVSAALVVGTSVLPSAASTRVSAAGTPVMVGMVYEKTGIFSVYAEEYYQGFQIGLDYATHGTGAVDGHHVDVTWDDDADSATTAVTDFKSLVGAGYKIIGGTIDSGVATELAPLAAQNQVLYVSGPAAADQITGANVYTFRSGRQTDQDVLTAESYVASEGRGKEITVLAQDYAFGESYVTDADKAFASIGDKVKPVLVPLTTTDFAPTALKVSSMHPDLLFLAWAGTTGAALAQALDNQGVFASTKVVTGLANIATYPFYGAAGTKFDYLSLYFYQAPHNAANNFLVKEMAAKYHSVPDIFTPDGFTAAEMIVHAIQAGGGSDVNAMIKALAGWNFLAPKGMQQIRAADHAMLQPMYQVKLTESAGTFKPVLVKTLADAATAPPVAAHFSNP
ncbi:MAG TPA: substrate-binding domain-containing protein [Acidimicrobiales bacterium]|nr:substrate-binding domain-containing protein [Acidimicrobiales bacterium]